MRDIILSLFITFMIILTAITLAIGITNWHQEKEDKCNCTCNCCGSQVNDSQDLD